MGAGALRRAAQIAGQQPVLFRKSPLHSTRYSKTTHSRSAVIGRAKRMGLTGTRPQGRPTAEGTAASGTGPREDHRVEFSARYSVIRLPVR